MTAKILENKTICFKDLLYWIYCNLSENGVLQQVTIRNCIITKIPKTKMPIIRQTRIKKYNLLPIYAWNAKLCGYDCKEVVIESNIFQSSKLQQAISTLEKDNDGNELS